MLLALHEKTTGVIHRYQCFLLTLLEPELKDYGFIRLTIDAAIYPVYIIITVDRYLHVTMYSQPSLALADISI